MLEWAQRGQHRLQRWIASHSALNTSYSPQPRYAKSSLEIAFARGYASSHLWHYLDERRLRPIV